MVIIKETGHGNPISNPGLDCLHVTLCLYPSKKYASDYSPSISGWIVGQTLRFNLGMATSLEERNSEYKPIN